MQQLTAPVTKADNGQTGSAPTAQSLPVPSASIPQPLGTEKEEVLQTEHRPVLPIGETLERWPITSSANDKRSPLGNGAHPSHTSKAGERLHHHSLFERELTVSKDTTVIPHPKIPLEKQSHDEDEHKAELAHRSSKQDFKALQHHIQELTEEKFMLQRGLEHQAILAQQLADENEILAQKCNEQSLLVEASRKDIDRLLHNISKSSALLDAATAEKDAAIAAAKESGHRARSLASEVVSLEERLLKFKVEGLAKAHHENQGTHPTGSVALDVQAVSQLQRQLHQTEIEVQELRAENLKLLTRCDKKNRSVGVAEDAVSCLMNSTDHVSNAPLPSEWQALLPMGIIENVYMKAGDSAVDGINEVVASINDLVTELETDKKDLIAALHGRDVEVAKLTEQNSKILQAQSEAARLKLESGTLEANKVAIPGAAVPLYK